MIKYFQSQINEIQDDIYLRLYGLGLALTHVWTYFYWNQGHFFINSQSAINTEPICFPLFPNCDLFRAGLSNDFWKILLLTYLFIACLTGLLFFYKELCRWAYMGLALVTAMKLFFHLSNYNFMGNYHYMVHFITLAYLFLPHKRILPKYLIVAFYVSAGFLKINIDWLSGAAMIRTPYIGGSFLTFSLYYVVFLELVFVFGLLHKNKWIRWITLAQLLWFHAFSWHVVGFYYPMVMFSLLSLFFMEEFSIIKDKTPAKDHLFNFFNFKEAKTIYISLGLFAFLQVLPFFMVSDPSLSGVARLSSLNMFDSKTECHSILVTHTEEGTIHLQRPIKNMGVRLRCDPIVFLNQAHQLCRENKKTQGFKKLSLHLFSKRVTQSQYEKVLDLDDVCALSNPLWGELVSQRSQ